MTNPGTQSRAKITLASPSFSGGGAERVMVTLANEFVNQGYSVDFLVLRDQGPYQTLLSPKARKITLTQGATSRPGRAFMALYRTFRYLRAQREAPVLSTIRELNLFFLIVHFLARARGPLFVREAATLDRFLDQPPFKDRLLFRLMKRLYPRANGVIANSEVTRADLLAHLGLPRGKVKAIYNPIDLAAIRQTASCTPKTQVPTLVACGRLVAMKNFDHTLRALALLREKHPQIRLKIIGEGPERPRLEKLSEELDLTEHVEFTGFLNDPFPVFAAAHVFVQTSRWEGFGYVMAEAMACGTPVVCYDSRGAMREILAEGRYGLLVTNNDIPALALALDQQLLSSTREVLLNEAAERFDVERIAKQYLHSLNV